MSRWTRAASTLAALLLAVGLDAGEARAAAGVDFVPVPGRFPPADVGQALAGELVALDHVERTGALRLDGDDNEDKYHSAPPHRFALLPYATIRYHGAPAELRDIPIGTHLHGRFVLPPDGDRTVPPPPRAAHHVPTTTHALWLEDDVSHHLRRGIAWRITSIELTYARRGGRDWRAAAASGRLSLHPVGEPAAIAGVSARTVEVDRSTRLWKGRGAIELEDLAPEAAWQTKGETRSATFGDEGGGTVQMNLTWAPGWMHRQFHCADLWVGAESLALAGERQRRLHVRHLRHRWLPGWIDQVEHQAGGKGLVTITLFGGMDPALYDEVRAQRASGGVAVAVAEASLRSYWQDHDNKGGPLTAVADAPDAPAGHPGLRITVRIGELLEGYRPGRIVRVRCNGWPNVKLPPEERLHEDRLRQLAPP